MTFNKYSAKISLLCMVIPYISALIEIFIPLPYTSKSLFKWITATLLALTGGVLAYLITSKSDSALQRLGLMEDFTKDIQKYWLIEYEDNMNIPCSILKICDNCDSTTESTVIDFNVALEIKRTMGIHGWLLDEHKRFSKIYAFGDSFHTFFRFAFKTKNEFDIIRIEDSDLDLKTVKKMKGSCKEITPRMLVDANVSFDEKRAIKDLNKFTLTPGSYALLLENIYKRQNTPYSKQILEAHAASISNGKSTISHQAANMYSNFSATETESKPLDKKRRKKGE